jgi:bifunctional non-homologous end joining protein LigD
MGGDSPVLVSWAVPHNLPARRGEPHLAVHVEDHPMEYGTFSGTIPKGNYGAGEVRIFDSGTYEVLEQADGKLSIRLRGERMRGVWHLNRTKSREGQDEWLVFLKSDESEPPEATPELKPMLAASRPDPFDDPRWLFEPKWDGVRTIAVCSDETILVSRTGRNVTETYPELGHLHEHLVAKGAIVDGEIVSFEGGRPSFERLQSRINLHNAHDIERATKSIPVTFIAFDLLYLDGRSLVDLPLERRKEVLEETVVVSSHIRVSSPCVTGEGVALSQAIRQAELEGIVAKKLGSPYRPGRRSREWLKIKVVHEADVVIGGWSRGEGSRSDAFGSLLVGAYDDEGLRFVGSVGTGFDRRTLDRVLGRLRPLESEDCPFVDDCNGLLAGRFHKTLKNPRWTRPELVAKVEYRELTASRRLRAPSFKGLRDDKPPEQCRLEDLVEGPIA